AVWRGAVVLPRVRQPRWRALASLGSPAEPVKAGRGVTLTTTFEPGSLVGLPLAPGSGLGRAGAEKTAGQGEKRGGQGEE
ncbi:hypothetical protein Q2363_26910, partial [Escherichia coli]|nr:hypothetical protein [Escherichia coli]